MMDESGETELKVQHSAILDPYVLIIRDDASCSLLFADQKGELDEVEHGQFVRDTKWTSGCLHRPSDADPAIYAFLLSMEGVLHVSALDALYYHVGPLTIFPHRSLSSRILIVNLCTQSRT